MRFFISLIIIIFLAFPGFGAEKELSLDNAHIHTYMGYTGYWKKVYSWTQLKKFMYEFGASYKTVLKLNGKLTYNRYIFIPYSKSYISYLMKYMIYHRPKVKTYDGKWLWPIHNIYRISSSFGMRWGKLHPGIDVPAEKGRPVLAALDGLITASGYTAGYGNCIYIKHRNAFTTLYAHNSVLYVKEGDIVRKGQIIALDGSTGNSTGSHLHFEMRYHSIPLNPMDFLPKRKNLNSPDLFKRK
jgi:murein DD-endopeptidase MepM/ murein hydrolase activator NlpD